MKLLELAKAIVILLTDITLVTFLLLQLLKYMAVILLVIYNHLIYESYHDFYILCNGGDSDDGDDEKFENNNL